MYIHTTSLEIWQFVPKGCEFIHDFFTFCKTPASMGMSLSIIKRFLLKGKVNLLSHPVSCYPFEFESR